MAASKLGYGRLGKAEPKLDTAGYPVAGMLPGRWPLALSKHPRKRPEQNSAKSHRTRSVSWPFDSGPDPLFLDRHRAGVEPTERVIRELAASLPKTPLKLVRRAITQIEKGLSRYRQEFPHVELLGPRTQAEEGALEDIRLREEILDILKLEIARRGKRRERPSGEADEQAERKEGQEEPVAHPQTPTPSEARARTVAKIIEELDTLKPQMYGESDYSDLERRYPDYLSFEIAKRQRDLRTKLLNLQSHRQHKRLAQELAAAHHGKQWATIQTDWKKNKPNKFRSKPH